MPCGDGGGIGLADASECAIHCKDLVKKFRKHPLFEGLSFDVPWGDHCAVIGENGSGKTTLLRILAGLTVFDSGAVTVGEAVLPPRLHKIPPAIGIALDGMNLLPQFSALENLHMLARLTPAHRTLADLKNLLADVGLKPDDQKPVGQFSLGMRQRLLLAQTLIPRPEVLLLDEPANGLDPEGVQWLVTWLRSLSDVTVVMASHRYEEVAATCTTVWRLEHGTIRQVEDFATTTPHD